MIFRGRGSEVGVRIFRLRDSGMMAHGEIKKEVELSLTLHILAGGAPLLVCVYGKYLEDLRL